MEEKKDMQVLIEEKNNEFPPGFLPRPNDHKVYAIVEDD